MEETIEPISRKKELGQFFSGTSVAALLAHLARAGEADKIIDPMCGTGDMLSACLDSRTSSPGLTGVEIDGGVFGHAMSRLGDQSSVKLIHGNAFQKEIIQQLLPRGYDLVITNPPYVRYQTMAGIKEDLASFLDMPAIRENLIWSLGYFQTLGEKDKELWKTLIGGFSGLSDLAVPAWILCSLLVKEGGRMAMVVPATWLSRDYALIIKYLLIRWFRIEYIIEDAGSAWFQPAQVKTVLIVARRIPGKDSLMSWESERFAHASIFPQAKRGDSLAGNAFPESRSAEADLVHAIDRGEASRGLFDNQPILIRDFAKDTLSMASDQKWFGILEPLHANAKLTSNGIKTSSELNAWYDGTDLRFCHLPDLGVTVSQGLRTGANLFFYLDFKAGAGEGEIIVNPDSVFGLPPFALPEEYTRKVVRKQAELDSSFSLRNFEPKGVVLTLRAYALPEDIAAAETCNEAFKDTYQGLSGPLIDYIRTAARVELSKGGETKLIPGLSAVTPNIRKWDKRKPDEAPRFWYMLPAFTRRHFPDLFIPRVNSDCARTRLNEGGAYLIDANFSSLWVEDRKMLYDNYALLALLNATWSQAAMEEYGTVMGGGALKLEATQIKKIPFPVLSAQRVKTLSELGRGLARGTGDLTRLIGEIDHVIVAAFGFNTDISSKIEGLSAIKQRLLKKRLK